MDVWRPYNIIVRLTQHLVFEEFIDYVDIRKLYVGIIAIQQDMRNIRASLEQYIAGRVVIVRGNLDFKKIQNVCEIGRRTCDRRALFAFTSTNRPK